MDAIETKVSEKRLADVRRFWYKNMPTFGSTMDTRTLEFAAAYAEDAERSREWIKVTPETMPTGEDHLLLCDSQDGNRAWTVVGYWNRLTGCWMVACRQQPGLPVTHYQPLPDLPSEGE